MCKPKSKTLTVLDFVAKSVLGSLLAAQDLCAVARTCDI